MNKILLMFLALSLSSCAPQTIGQKQLNTNVFNKASCRQLSNVNSAEQNSGIGDQQECNKPPKTAPEKEKAVVVKQPGSPLAKYPKVVIKNVAMETCKEAVRIRLYDPYSMKPDMSSATFKALKNGDAAIKLPFKAKTGLGEASEQIAYCTIDKNGEIILLNIVNK